MSPPTHHTYRHAEQQLSQTILDRKQIISAIGPETPEPDILTLHHLWADKLHVAILDFTCATNMVTVARILDLPRELRDNIYTHLWDFDEDHDPNRDLIYWWDSSSTPWFEKDDDLSKSPWLTTPTMHLRPPHFVDKVFVGPTFAQEVLERFQDTVGKDLRPVGERYPLAKCGLFDAFIQDFVRKDVFSVGMTMEELTRNMDLRVTFQCDVLADKDFSGDIDESNGVYVKEYLSTLKDCGTALLSISHTDRIITHDEHSRHLEVRPRIVTLVLGQETGFSNCLPVILEIISRIYNGLRRKGFTVKLQYYSEEIKLKIVFKDDVWEWTDSDWRDNLTRKNLLEEDAGDSESHSRACVWSQLRKYLFKDSGNNALSQSL